MHLSEVNPYIRFAERIRYRSAGQTVIVQDCRVFYILSGSGTIEISGQIHELKEDAVFYCCADSVYTIISDGLALISLNFDLDQSRQELTDSLSPIPAGDRGTIPINGEHVDGEDFINSHIYIECGRKYLAAMEDILSEFVLRRKYYQQKSGGILKNLLTEVARDQTLSASNSTRAVSRIMGYIESHLAEPISNRGLAALAGYHTYHLNRLFLKQTGQSIHQYILTRRLNEAKKFLLSTDLSVSEIAEKCGFNSASHFSSYFKQQLGFSPLQFRMKFKNYI